MSNNAIVDTPVVGQKVTDNDSLTAQMQSLLESYELAINSGKMNEYTVATVPDATKNTGSSIMVTDESGGYTQAFSDGTNWRRVQDRAIIT
jgi:hypothetical protein